MGEYNCCSEYGFCGNSEEYCSCDNCINFGLVITDKVRNDGRCGLQFPLDDGAPSQYGGTVVKQKTTAHVKPVLTTGVKKRKPKQKGWKVKWSGLKANGEKMIPGVAQNFPCLTGV